MFQKWIRRGLALALSCMLLCAGLTMPVRATKLLALTFDDGPSAQYTPEVLAQLQERNAKATFFMVGKWLPGKVALVREMVVDGQQIANHTQNHVHMTDLTPPEMRAEVSQASAALEAITGQKEYMLRPPYGARSKELCANIAAPVLLWSIDPAEGKQVSGGDMAKTILSKARDGDIVLMHDTTPANVEAIALVMDKLKARGFSFVTLDELFRLKGVVPQNGVIYKRVSNANPQGYDESKLKEHWAYSAICQMQTRGAMRSDTDGWHPNRYLSRGMTVTVLWRLGGSPTVATGKTGVGDVEANQWYSTAVSWAKIRGLTQGQSTIGFGVSEAVTREQLYVMVARLMNSEQLTKKPLSDCPHYGDDDRMGVAEAESVLLLRQLGFVSQNDVELFRPKDPATRAEAAELFCWFLKVNK